MTRDYDSKCPITKITYETISVDGIVKRSHHLENPTDTVKHSANNITVITKEISELSAASNHELKRKKKQAPF